MNYLAHLYLSEPHPESLVGSLMGDFVRGSDLGAYSERLRQGIVLHRKVDRFTDTHPVVCESKRHFRPESRRYAGIILDISFDHFLARDWSRYSAVPLGDFCMEAYGALRAREGVLPERMRRAVDDMIAQDRLQSYRSLEGIAAAFGRTARWCRSGSALERAADELLEQYDRIEADFARFFPDLVRYAAEFRQALESEVPAVAPGFNAAPRCLPGVPAPAGLDLSRT